MGTGRKLTPGEYQYYMHQCLIRYGKFLEDVELKAEDGHHRIRIISYQNKLFFDHMCNGDIVVLHEISNGEG